MKFFTLLIDGKDIDTKRYRYLPYAHKAIEDPFAALKAQKAMQKNDAIETSDIIYAKYCLCDEEIILKAIESAHQASLIYREFSFSRRVKIMSDIYELLLSKKEILIELMVIEGHPRKLAEWEFSGMEMAYRSESINFFKTQLRGSYGETSADETIGWIRKPDGVVCVSPPGNASCSNSLTAGFALLGGNTIIVKPPLRAPISTLFLWRDIVWEALKKNKAPAGTVNTLVGNSKLITELWLNSPLVNDLFFFGDSVSGTQIGLRAFQSGKKPILEMSGNDMMLVWKDCDLKSAVNSLQDAFLGSTQICMVPKKALIHEDVYEEFEKLFVEQAQSIKVGLPNEDDTCLTPVIRTDDFFIFLNDALEKGAKLLCGGQQVNYKGAIDPNGSFILPTVIYIENWEKAMEMKCVQEENFFPLIPLIKVSCLNDQNHAGKDGQIFKNMIFLANSNKYGLRTSVWVNSTYYIPKFIRQLNKSGLLRINSKHTGFSPFLSTHGGTGLSGGPFGELNYVWQKTTHLQGVSVFRPNVRKKVAI